jgi:putative DNA primase/helicase
MPASDRYPPAVSLSYAQLRHVRDRLAVAYNPTAQAPRWERFLQEVFAPTPEVVPFMQELLGYMFTGYTDPHHVTFFYGAGGRNGKSTLCKILQPLCRDYTWTFNTQRIFGHKSPDIPNDIADFKGYRFVYSNELPKQVKLTSTLVKLLSGGDEIVARQLFAVNLPATVLRNRQRYMRNTPMEGRR